MQSEQIDAYLDDKIIKTGIPVFSPDDNLSQYVNMEINDLEKLTSNKAIDIAYKLESGAANIQAMANRLNAHLIYVKSNLNKAFARVSNNYDSFDGKEIKFAKACLDHEEINELEQLKLRLETELEDIKFTASHLRRMSQLVESMKWRNR